jgi:PTH1 family peptidyl-tRNA hydrolase
VVGLGNPGRRYQDTRHNVGFEVLDALAQKSGVCFHPDKRGPAEVAKAGEAILLKPQTFMNLSGVAVRAWLDWQKWEIEEVLAIVDDIALPLGQIRLRGEGGSGGHNGVASLIEHLGTEKFARLRCGIGPQPPGVASEDYVLARFAEAEITARNEMVARAVEAVEICREFGLEAAMNRFNQKSGDKKEEKENRKP